MPASNAQITATYMDTGSISGNSTSKPSQNGTQVIITKPGISDKDTVANMTNHSYFNLNGHDSGTAMNHKLCINASKYIQETTTSSFL